MKERMWPLILKFVRYFFGRLTTPNLINFLAHAVKSRIAMKLAYAFSTPGTGLVSRFVVYCWCVVAIMDLLKTMLRMVDKVLAEAAKAQERAKFPPMRGVLLSDLPMLQEKGITAEQLVDLLTEVDNKYGIPLYAPGTVYLPRMRVEYNGEFYICIREHVTPNIPGQGGFWTRLLQIDRGANNEHRKLSYK